MAESSESQSEMITIAATGDVILVAGQHSVKLRVNSTILRTASQVFEAMLGPNFAEGQELSSTTPKEIKLEEDDAEAMKVICQVLHFKLANVPHAVDPPLFLNISKLVDKYFLQEAFTFYIEKWFSIEDIRKYQYAMEDLVRLLEIAMLLKLSEGFMAVTRRLVMTCQVCPYMLLSGGNTSEITTVLATIFKRRDEFRVQLLSALDEVQAWPNTGGACQCARAYANKLGAERTNGSLDTRSVFSSRLAWTLHEFSFIDRPDDEAYRCDSKNGHHWYQKDKTPSGMWARLQSAVAAVRNFEGLEPNFSC